MKSSAPRRSSLSPRYLAAAPELAVLAMLDRALMIAVQVLIAEHPTLAAHPAPPDHDPPSLREARRLVRAARTLRRGLARYRLAVRAALLAPDSETDNLPF
jgi:hypothetical protein